jgi:3-isopropylmalate dehydrogenase
MSRKILVLAGDGIGPEVCDVVKKIILHLNEQGKTDFEIQEELIGGVSIDERRVPLTDEVIEIARNSDAVLLGAVGGPKWENMDYNIRPERGLLAIRKELGLFANLRPAITFPELVDSSSLKAELVSGLDLMIVRELTGGIYFGEPRGVREENGLRVGINTLRYDEKEIDRIARVAFDIARKRGKRVCSVDKANVLESTELWREVVQDVRDKDYKDIELSHMYVDNASMQLVREPKQFDVMVTTNLFGDILSDTASMLTGSLGMLPSASLGEEINGKRNALYEPVHGSAPDIAGKNIANPVATVLSFEMMLRYSFGMMDVADSLNKAVKEILAEGFRSADIMSEGMKSVSTSEIGELIISKLY